MDNYYNRTVTIEELYRILAILMYFFSRAPIITIILARWWLSEIFLFELRA